MIMRRIVRLNWKVIMRLEGWLMAIDALLMMITIVGGWLYDGRLSLPFMLIALATAACGVGIALGCRPKAGRLMLHDAIFLTAFTWILFSMLGALPFMWGPQRICFVDALFESVSGYTSTGSSVIPDVEALPGCLLLWRSLSQWVGGVGIIMFFLAVIPMLNNREGVRLFNTEVSGLTDQKFRPRISQTAKGILTIYAAMTIMETLLLWAGPMNFFDAINQSMATLSTGGFSTRNASIAAWNSSYVEIVVAIFMFLGGVNLQLMYLAAIGHLLFLVRNDTFRYYALIVLVVTAFIVINRVVNTEAAALGDNIRTTMFTVVSAISSTGFTCVNFENWGTDALFAILIIMFFGACAGSTTSGAKTDRLIFLVKNTRNIFYKTIHPNHLPVVRVNGQIISPQRVSEVIGFLSIYVLIVVVCAMIVAGFGLSLQDSLFASISSMSNIGLGYGATGAGGSYAALPMVAKLTLTVEMLVGRLEIFTFLLIFLPCFWRR